MTERPETEILDPSSDYGPLGPCGCNDYHYADCPTRTGYSDDPPEPHDDEDWTSEILAC
jgi:hypothetical protein